MTVTIQFKDGEIAVNRGITQEHTNRLVNALWGSPVVTRILVKADDGEAWGRMR